MSWDVLVQITGGGERYRELHPSPVRRHGRAVLRRRSRQPELGALVAGARARERAHDARHRAVGSVALDQRALPVGHARARRRDVASAPLRHSFARRRALPADQRLARRHDEPRRGLSVLPLGPRHRARRHDDAHHRRRGRDAARPRESRALRQHAVDGRAAVAVGVPDVPAEGAPAHLRPRRHRVSA